MLRAIRILGPTLASLGAVAAQELVRVPGFWERRFGGPVEEHDGFAWYRCLVEVPAAWRGRSLVLELGRIDDCDETFLNGVAVGSSGTREPYRTASALPRSYTLDPSQIRFGGWNVVAVRVFDGGGAGGFGSGPVRLRCAAGMIPLEGRWELRLGDDASWARTPLPDARFAHAIGFSVDDGTRLSGTAPLTDTGDLATRMVLALRGFLRERIDTAIESRTRFTRVGGDVVEFRTRRRARLQTLIGAVDPLRPVEHLQVVATTAGDPVIARTVGFTVREVRWPVLDDVDGHGLLLEPDGAPAASVVFLPDADGRPQRVAGIGPDVPLPEQLARRLAMSGCRVVVPFPIDRGTRWSGNPRIGRKTSQPHREWIYRQAYELGRHPIGYDVQVVRALVDWLARDAERRIGVFGYGEGGLIAMHAAALEPRIAVAVVSGHFRARDELWREPIYRNVWRYLAEFGDAGVASLIAPRTLVVEASAGPEVVPTGSTPGTLAPAPFAAVRAEFLALTEQWATLGGDAAAVQLIGDGTGAPGRPGTLSTFLRALGVENDARSITQRVELRNSTYDSESSQRRQLEQWVEHTQRLMRTAHERRAPFWQNLDYSSLDAYQRSIAPHRERFRERLVGELPRPTAPLEPRSRLRYLRDSWIGHDVTVSVWPGTFAHAILLVPRDLDPGERRPVIVCQHGLEGRAEDVVNPDVDTRFYHSFGARLADRGFVVLAPQNLYIGGDDFRVLQRMANPLGATLFALVTRMHERLLDWLATQAFVDPDRIAFYGLSYGGKTAMRVPPLIDRYCLSICSADFNEWLVKNVTVDSPYSYMFSGEYDMYEWDLGNTFNYAEMAALIAPRPFMVERGHEDGVAPDEWVAHEYARVRRLYARLGIPDRTRVEFFAGPHEIHGVGTFRFLHDQLRWPEAR